MGGRKKRSNGRTFPWPVSTMDSQKTEVGGYVLVTSPVPSSGRSKSKGDSGVRHPLEVRVRDPNRSHSGSVRRSRTPEENPSPSVLLPCLVKTLCTYKQELDVPVHTGPWVLWVTKFERNTITGRTWFESKKVIPEVLPRKSTFPYPSETQSTVVGPFVSWTLRDINRPLSLYSVSQWTPSAVSRACYCTSP